MSTLDLDIQSFIDRHFPDIDYSILGKNKDRMEHKMGLCYEYFVNAIEYFSIQKTIDSEAIKILSTGDMRGIDGCFFVLNKQLFTVPEWDNSDLLIDWKNYFDEEVAKCSTNELTFFFIQSKSTKTELDKFKGFCGAVYDVFSTDENDLTENSKVKTLNYVFKEVCKRPNNLYLSLRFCSIPKDSRQIENLLDNTDWKAAIDKNKRDLKSTKFTDVKIELKSGQDYQDKLEEILSPNQREYQIQDIEKRFIKIENEGATCYIGFLNLSEIKNILQNDTGDLDNIFFDNIRYFEGLGEEGSVNTKIYKSLANNSSIFNMLHNGITITAHSKHYNQANGDLVIKAFSIINGCQTCNLIWLWIEENEQKIKEKYLGQSVDSINKCDEEINKFKNLLLNTRIPVKIVITSDPNLRTQITEAANTQNQANSIQLIAISEEAKKLQKLFNDEIRPGDTIYFERLSNQYPDIGDSYKLSSEDVFRAFYSTFGKSPHKLTVGYGKFEREKLKQKDFLATKNDGKPKYDVQAYHISSLLFNYLQRYLRSQSVSLISLRHHLLLLLSISIDINFESINPESKLPSKFLLDCKSLIADRNSFNQRIEHVCRIAIDNFDFFIENLSGKPKVRPKSYYTEEGTEKMILIFKEKFFTDGINTTTNI